MPRSTHSRRPITPALALKHLFFIVAVLIAAGCSGGGCGGGGCSSCGGVTPLPGGFDPQARIENAGSVRLTQSGLDFLSQNLGTLAKGLLGAGNGGTITFDIPQSSGSAGVSYTLCPNGSKPNANPKVCVAELDIGSSNLDLTTSNSYDLHVKGTIPIRVQDLQVKLDLGVCAPTINVAVNGDGSCPGGNFDSFPVDVDIAIHVDQNQQHSRFGYSKVEIKQILNDASAKQNIQNHLEICDNVPSCIQDLCGCALAAFADWDVIKGLVVDQLYSQIAGTLNDQIAQQLCQKPNPDLSPTCPTGTNDYGDGICRYSQGGECASIILGTDGHIDLGGLLASISPGTKGGLDFLFAAGGPSPSTNHPPYAWGDLDPSSNGATLGLYGGAQPNPISKCVKFSDLALPTGIPIPDELLGNTVPNWPINVPGPHFGLAVSERYANYALNGVYNSGLLCIGVSTESVPLLNSGTLGLLAASSKDLTIQHESQQIGIVIRPSSPPKIAFGNGTDIKTDPLLRVTLNQASFDFYIFSLDRYIRFMTATFDLDVPVNLTVGPDGLTPVLDKIGVNNGKVTNNSLLREKPDLIAAALGDLIASQVGQAVGGGVNPIDINASLASLGLKLIIPDTVDGQGSPGLRKLTKDSDNYLGIFAAFEVADPNAPVPPSETKAELLSKHVDAKGLKLVTIQPDNAPALRILATSSLDDGTRAIEYGYRVDKGFWHPYTRDRHLNISDGFLRLQGKHVIQVRSRVVGQPMTLDPTPAEVEVVIDAEPPAIKVGQVENGKIALQVRDMVSAKERTMVRVKLDKGDFSQWMPASSLTPIDVGEAAEIAVEARDEEGNVATAQQALLRGRDTAATSGCGCTVAGADEASPRAWWLVGVALAGIGARLLRRGRRAEPAAAEAPAPASPAPARRTLAARTLAPLAMIAVASTWAGCSCGGDSNNLTGGGHTTGGNSTSGGGCVSPCVPLEPGLIGAYTSVAVSGKDVWVSGYAEANWDIGYTWGDLIVGKWDGTKVDWQSVDGVPSDPPPDPTVYDVNGFRGGQTEAGDDVGIWTSIAIDSKGNPAVSYYDRTHKALKFAHFDGKEWSSHTVEGGTPGVDAGRYSKLLATGSGFVIAYEKIMGGGDDGALISSVRVATSASESPAAGGDWGFEDAVVSKTTPCRAAFCASDEACLASTSRCTKKATGCSPACTSGTACIDDQGTLACAATIDANKIDTYPDAVGDYVSLAVDPQGNLGIAYYDRTNGNLGVASKVGGAWTTMVVDGADVQGNDTGDVGVGANLFIDDNGDWHLAYVDGLAESLKYVRLVGGTQIGAYEVVDDGLGVAGAPFDDGQHLVGDDAHIAVLSGGEVHITYQDATSGTLHHAVGTPSADTHTWSVKVIPQEGKFAGAFSNVVVADGKLQLVNWWRVGGKDVKGDVAIVSP